MKIKTTNILCSLVLIIFVIISCSSSTEIGNQELPAESLLLHYKFNGNSQNEINSLSDGKNYEVQLTQDRFKRDSSAYYFNGYNSHIDIGNGELTKPDFPITLSVWVKKTDNEQGWIFGNNLNSANYMGIFLGFGDGNLLSLHFGNGGAVGSSAARRSVYAIDPIELSKWYHVVGIIESADSMRLFLNGNEKSTVYSGTADKIVYDEGIACFGKFHNWQYQQARFYKGVIDDFRLYSRTLTEQEIIKLYLEE